jgi:hypothetical protein
MSQQRMRPRKLLIVTYHFPPSGAVAAFRMLGFARHLPRFGWQVGVVAPPRVPHEPVDEALLDRVPPKTTVFPAPYPDSLPAQLATRFVYHGVWVPRALPAILGAVHRFKPDAVLTSGPPHCVHFLRARGGLVSLAALGTVLGKPRGAGGRSHHRQHTPVLHGSASGLSRSAP